MKLIVAVDEEWGIGKNNKLLFDIPEDMAYFKAKTNGNIVVMGLRTFESLPNKKPLPNRLNIVLSDQPLECKNNMVVVKSMEELFDYLKTVDSNKVFVIGGGSIYKQLLNYCSESLITKVFANVEKDVSIPNLDELDNWSIIEKSDIKEYNNIKFQFLTYKNSNVTKY